MCEHCNVNRRWGLWRCVPVGTDCKPTSRRMSWCKPLCSWRGWCFSLFLFPTLVDKSFKSALAHGHGFPPTLNLEAHLGVLLFSCFPWIKYPWYHILMESIYSYWSALPWKGQQEVQKGIIKSAFPSSIYQQLCNPVTEIAGRVHITQLSQLYLLFHIVCR